MKVRKCFTKLSLVVSLSIAMNLFVFICFSFAVCPDGMIAYWKLEEDSNSQDFSEYTDETALSNNGICASACPMVTSDGVENNGQLFNGIDNGIAITQHDVFDWDVADSFTIELWLKRQSGISSREILIGRDDLFQDLQWWVGLTSTGHAIFYLESSGGEGASYFLEGSAKLDNDVWHHIVAIRDASQNKILLFVDGRSYSIDAPYESGFSSTQPVTIGYLKEDDTSMYNFQGTIDEIAMYNRVLSKKEILTHYYLAKGYCSLYDSPVKIMPLGDSITYDDYTGAPPGTGWRVAYRQPLYLSLVSAHYWVDFVGSQIAGETAIPVFDTDNESYPGIRDDQVAAQIFDWLSENPADVILLHIGTNSLDTDPSDVENILDQIDLFNQKTTVVLSRIIERVGDIGTTHEFNDEVESMALSRIDNGDKIIMVDMEDGAGLSYTIGVDMLDDIHPNESGYKKMAAAWYDVLDDFLPQSSISNIFSVPNALANRGELYTYQVQVNGKPFPSVTLLDPDPPPDNFYFDPQAKIITWVPGEFSDEISVGIKATNWAGTDIQEFRIPINDAPTIADIQNQVIEEGERFNVILLDEFVEDPDNPDDEISWGYTGNSELKIDITNRIASINIPNEDWNGMEIITFRATDPGGLFDEHAVLFQVVGINDKPEIVGYKALETSKDTEFEITLSDLTVKDPDNIYPDDFDLKVYNGANYQVSINETGYLITPKAGYIGTLTIPVSVVDGTDESNIINMKVTVVDQSDNQDHYTNNSDGGLGCFIRSVSDIFFRDYNQ